MQLNYTKMTKKRIVVICPGRGSYSRETSNYLVDGDSNLTSLIRSHDKVRLSEGCLLYTSPSPRDKRQSRMPSSA